MSYNSTASFAMAGHPYIRGPHPQFFIFGPHRRFSVEAVTAVGNRCSASSALGAPLFKPDSSRNLIGFFLK